MSKLSRFAFLPDIHYGFERRNGHKVALQDDKAINATLSFLEEFKPHTIILGGDTLDCGAISHHNHGKPGKNEGLKLLADAQECRANIISPLEAIGDRLIYIEGNHEEWLHHLTDEMPALEGIVDLKSLLGLKKWELVPQGESTTLGKLVFIHGDQLSGGEHMAKNATLAFERNVRFGHFHTYQVYTKTSALDMNGHTGVCVPCLCKKNPKYGLGAPNKWMQGFNWGYIAEDGLFNDYVSVIVNGKFIANGKEFRG